MFYSDAYGKIDDFTFIVLAILVPVFDLRMSFWKVCLKKAGKFTFKTT